MNPGIKDCVNNFALRLFKALKASTSGNVIFSPAGILTGLSLPYAGAAGNTALEFQNVLGLAPNAKTQHENMREFQNALAASQHERLSLLTANKLFAAQHLSLNQEYAKTLWDYYSSSLEYFSNDPEESADRINAWVSEQTENLIREIVSAEHLSGEIKLLLVNAIYFKGKWAEPFLKESTMMLPFHVGPGRNKETPTMQICNIFQTAQTRGTKIIALPYVGHEIELLALLPEKRFALDDLEMNLSIELFDCLLESLAEEFIWLRLPKFSINSFFPLRQNLTDMGLEDAFSNSRANFSGISETPLCLNSILHKAYIEVEEEGTEAAAATAVEAVELGMTEDPPKPKEFFLDEPFLFFIRHKISGAILFMGRVAEF